MGDTLRGSSQLASPDSSSSGYCGDWSPLGRHGNSTLNQTKSNSRIMLLFLRTRMHSCGDIEKRCYESGEERSRWAGRRAVAESSSVSSCFCSYSHSYSCAIGCCMHTRTYLSRMPSTPRCTNPNRVSKPLVSERQTPLLWHWRSGSSMSLVVWSSQPHGDLSIRLCSNDSVLSTLQKQLLEHQDYVRASRPRAMGAGNTSPLLGPWTSGFVAALSHSLLSHYQFQLHHMEIIRAPLLQEWSAYSVERSLLSSPIMHNSISPERTSTPKSPHPKPRITFQPNLLIQQSLL